MMRQLEVRISILLFGAFFIALPFAAADVYVLRENDGTAYTNLGKDAVPVFIDRFSDAGSLLGTISLPTVAGAGTTPNPLTLVPESTSLGHLSLSTDGQYLLLGGYSSPVGTTTARVTLSTAAPRVIGRIKLSDNSIDTTTALTDAYTGNGTSSTGDLRSVVSTDGTQFWTFGSGFGAAASGARYVASLGATTSTQLSTTPTNVRVGRIVNGQLYESASTTAGSGFVGISTIGTGLPTTAGQTTTLRIPTGAATANSSAYDFWFKDPYTVYIADDRAVSNTSGPNGTGGGIQKWVAKVAGDYNGDNVVDAADFVTWRDQDGTSPATPGTGADGDGSGFIDSLDYDYWRARFGETNLTWSFAYVLNTGLASDNVVRGLDGKIDGGNTVLYATTGTSGFNNQEFLNDNALVTVTDTGAASAFSTLASSPTTTFFRGVAYVPVVVVGSGSDLAGGAVPEPTSAGLLALFGLMSLGWRRR
jgi:hypothetical protein